MEPAPARESPLNVEGLTDEQLVQLLPVREEDRDLTEEEQEELEENGLTAEEKREKRLREAVAKLTAQERQAIEELWRRYSKTIEKYLAYKIYGAGSTLCPPQEPDKKHFVKMCVHETYIAFLVRARRQAIRKSFQALLYTIALREAISLRRQIAKTRGPAVEMGPLDDQKVIEVEGWGADKLVVLRELRDILDEYAAKSLENAVSIRVGRLRRRESMTWQEVLATIEKLLPGGVPGSTPGARMKKLRDKEKHDRNDLLPLLQEYNISGPSLFDALFEL